MPSPDRDWSSRIADPTAGLESYTAPAETWTGTHHKHTLWLSDELWEAISAIAASTPDTSKSAVVEEAGWAFVKRVTGEHVPRVVRNMKVELEVIHRQTAEMISRLEAAEKAELLPAEGSS